MDRSPRDLIGYLAVALHHAPLRRQDARLGVLLLDLAMVGDELRPFRVSPALAAASGWSSSKTSATRSLRRLADLGVLTRWLPDDRYSWELQLPERWRWDADAATLFAAAWNGMTGSCWGEADQLVSEARTTLDAVPRALLPDRERPTWHPTDPPTQRWIERLTRLVERHGWITVRTALRTAARDPESVAPWTPSAFAREIWALTIRGRRMTDAALR